MREIPSPPVLFAWYENHVESCLAKLHRLENHQQRVISQTVASLKDAPHFWKLMTAYNDVVETGDREAKIAALHAFAARLFIAGTYHPYPLQEEIAE